MNATDRITAASNRLRREAVMHSKKDQAFQELRALAHHAIPGHVYLLVGPAGAGATSVARHILKTEIESARPHNPFLAVELSAHTPTEARFSYKSFWQSGLEAVEAPVLGQHRRAVESPSRLTEFIGCAEFRSGERYRKDFQNVLGQRGARLCIVTKAHNLLKRLHEDDYDVPLAAFHDLVDNRLQLPQAVILSGNAPLLRVRNRVAELDLHTTVVYVWPLDKSERKEFIAVLKTYEEMLEGILDAGTLVCNAASIFEATKGCDGWLRRALVRAVALLRKDCRLSWEQIECQLPTLAERTLLDQEVELIRHHATGKIHVPAITQQQQSPSRRTTKRRITRRRVGERKPGRDWVGLS